MTTDQLTEHKTSTEHFFTDEDENLQGDHKLWYTNGQLHVHCFFVDDERHGEYKYWYAGGQKRGHCFYVDDERHGESKWWHANGQLADHVIYLNGKETDIPIPTTDEDRFALVLEHGHMQFIKDPA